MTCEHCKGHMPKLVTLDKAYHRLTDVQAAKLNGKTRLIIRMVGLLKADKADEALELGQSVINHERFKG